MAATRRHPDVVMFGSTQIDVLDQRRLDGVGDHYLVTGLPWRGGHGWSVNELPAEGEVFAPCAAACLIRADAFREANGFDERFFCYVEDIDLAFRLRLGGHLGYPGTPGGGAARRGGLRRPGPLGVRRSMRDAQSDLVLRQVHAGAVVLAATAISHPDCAVLGCAAR